MYRFINVIRDSLAIFEQGQAKNYANYTMLITIRDNLWACWKQFIGHNLITPEFLVDQTFLHGGLQSAIRHMVTSRLAPHGLSQRMADIRTMAKHIAAEGESVWNLIIEAVIRLDERDEGHKPERQFPSFSSYSKLSKDTLLGIDDEDEEQTPQTQDEPHIRDSSSLIGTSFDPIWIRGEDFEGEMSEELREAVGDGRGKYLSFKASCLQKLPIDSWQFSKWLVRYVQ